MKAHVIPMRGGEETDMLTRWRHVLRHDRGRSRAAKRAYNRRQRRVLRKMNGEEDDILHGRPALRA